MTDNPEWQPRHDDPLFILAMDHRASFGKTLFGVKDDNPAPQQVAAMRSAKRMIFDGLRAALPALPYGRAGVLVDERYGQDVIDAARATGNSVVLAVPVEASGHDWFTLEWGDQWLPPAQGAKPAHAKILARARRGDQARLRQDPGPRQSRLRSGRPRAAIREAGPGELGAARDRGAAAVRVAGTRHRGAARPGRPRPGRVRPRHPPRPGRARDRGQPGARRRTHAVEGRGPGDRRSRPARGRPGPGRRPTHRPHRPGPG